MAYQKDPIRNAQNVYGPRKAGGYQGVTLTDGVYNEYEWDLTIPGNTSLVFPAGNGIKVVGLHTSYVTGTITAIAVGGVSILAATDAAPVTIPEGNTGVLTQTGGTAGPVIIKYINVEGDPTHFF